MPELPEVETVKNVLLPIVKDRKILSIEVLPIPNREVKPVHADGTAQVGE